MSKESYFPIEYAHDARLELEEILVWNERHYGEEHANQYIRFCEAKSTY